MTRIGPGLGLWFVLAGSAVAVAASFAQDGGTRVRLFVDSAVPDPKAQKVAKESVEVLERRLENMGWSGASVRPEGTRDLVVEVPRLQDRTVVGEICSASGSLAFRLVALDGEKGTLVPQMDGSPARRVVDEPIVTEQDLLDAQPAMDPGTQNAMVNIRLTSAATARFGKATTDNVGRAIAIVVEGNIVSAPIIRTPITGGALQIAGPMTPQNARWLAVLLRSGPLPAALHVQSTDIVEPRK